MSEGIPEGQDSQVTGTEDSTQGQVENTGTGLNPAWNDLLSSVPAGLHSQMTPHLEKWDQNFQNKINEVHSQYQPYNFLLENQVQPDQIQYALGIMNAIEEKPEEVIRALQEYMGVGNEQQGQEDTGGPGVTDQPEWMQSQEWQRMNETVNAIAQIMVQQRDAQANAAVDSEINAELAAAKEKFGEFDENWVLTKCLNEDLTIEQAAEAYQQFEQSILQKHTQKPGPPVLGAGGSVAQTDFQPGKLDGKDRRSLVAQMLQQGLQNNH